jgi:hypothetical protein
MKKHHFDIEDEKEAIRKEILRLYKFLGKTPTQKEYKQYSNSEFSLGQIIYRYGNWSNAIIDAGLTPNPLQQPPRQPEITNEELIEEFIKVANELGKIPGIHTFHAKKPKYSWTPYKTKWGSWSNAVEFIVNNYEKHFNFDVKKKWKKATPSNHPKKKQKLSLEEEKELIRKEILKLHGLLGKTPTQKEYEQHSQSEYTIGEILYRYGKWSNAIIDAGLRPNSFQTPPRTPEITQEELVNEFIRVANKFGKIPSTTSFRAEAKYSWTPYKTKWGSWRDAKNFIIENYTDRFNFEVIPTYKKKQKFKRKKLKFRCPLLYEPINEFETIVLFAYLAEELKYKIKQVQSEFPDGILEKDGKEILVEFEYLSSNYIQHCHPLDFEGICICWRKDEELGSIPIISLEEYVRLKYKNN